MTEIEMVTKDQKEEVAFVYTLKAQLKCISMLIIILTVLTTP